MMLAVDFNSLGGLGRQPKGLVVTVVVNWLIKPLTMTALAWLFIRVLFGAWIPAAIGDQYIAGMILLGVAPCTAMVFVWSRLCDGDANYTLAQVAINDLIMVFAFAPLAALLLGVTKVIVPWDTLVTAVGLFVIVPLAAGWLTRLILRTPGRHYFGVVHGPGWCDPGQTPGNDRCLQFLRAGGCRGHKFIWPQLRRLPGSRGGGAGGGASDAFAGGDCSEK